MKQVLCVMLIAVVAGLSSCGKAVADGIDCFGESLLVSVSYTAAANPKEIHFNINYDGNFTIGSVVWDYGDNNSATVNGRTAIHTYTTAGSYTVKAKVSLKRGSATCIPEPVKNITVN